MSVRIWPISTYTTAAAYVAKHMREEDVEELWSLSRVTPEEAVRSSVDVSNEAYVAIAEEPLAVFGVFAPALGDVAAPWFLGTDGVRGHGGEYIRWGRRFIEHLHREHAVLRNAALATNRDTLVFLSRLGFDIGKPFLTVSGAEAVLFERKRTHV